MATVTGKTSAKIDELLGQTLVGGELSSEGALVFTRKNGSVINAGSLGSSIVSAVINSAKHLILTKKDGSSVDAGSIVTPALEAWPVGSVYIGVTPADPAALLGGGTWEPFAQGRMLVGVNPSDPSFDAVQETGGAKSRALTESNLPPHTHAIDHDHPNPTLAVRSIANTPAGGDFVRVTDVGGVSGASGGDLHNATVNIAPFVGASGAGSGSAQPIDVMNPYITTYMWKRTA